MKEMSEANRPQADDKLNEIIDHFAEIHKHEQLCNGHSTKDNVTPKAHKHRILKRL